MVLTQVEIANISRQLGEETPQAILRWAVERFYPKLTMATAFGAEGCCIIHMLAEIKPRVRIFNLDTGYQFHETLQVRERIKVRYGIEVELITPETTVNEYEQQHGGPLYKTAPNQCCHDRKTLPLRRAIAGHDAWISAIRRDQTEHRARASVVQADNKFGLVKINPLLAWTRKDVWDFILQHHIPYNPLHDLGYPSIGCWPCTIAAAAGGNERSGRWAGTGKTECGLHVQERREAA